MPFQTSNVPEQDTQASKQPKPEVNSAKMDEFMAEMSKHVNKMGSEAVSRQMLQNQQSLLRDHARVLEGNQDVLRDVLQETTRKKKKSDYDSQRMVIAEMMKPMLEEMKNIKELYDQTKNKALNVEGCLTNIKREHKLDMDEDSSKKFPGVFEDYVGTQNKLRKKFEQADNLAEMYKKKFKDLENFESVQYMRNLKKMNNQLSELETRAKDGQIELERRITGINKKYELMLPASYLDIIEKDVARIDLIKSKSTVIEKLGGELDYQDFQLGVQDILEEYRQTKEDFLDAVNHTEIDIPEIEPDFYTEYAKRVQDTPSVLESIKDKISKMKSRYNIQELDRMRALKPEMPNQYEDKEGVSVSRREKAQKIVQENAFYFQGNNFSQGKPGVSKKVSGPVSKPPPRKQRTGTSRFRKPDHLRTLETKPINCKVDIKFRKIGQDSNDFNTFFEQPEQHVMEEMRKKMGETEYDNFLKQKALDSTNQGNNNPNNPNFLGRGNDSTERKVYIRTPQKTNQMIQTVRDEKEQTSENFYRERNPKGPFSTTDKKQKNLKNGGGGLTTQELMNEDIDMQGNEEAYEDDFSDIEEENDSFRPSNSRKNQAPKKTIYEGLDDPSDTRRMIDRSRTSRNGERSGSRDMVQKELEKNMPDIQKYFASKIPKTPYTDYERKLKPLPAKESVGFQTMEVEMEPLKKTQPVDMDDLANNILGVFNKALEKAQNQNNNLLKTAPPTSGNNNHNMRQDTQQSLQLPDDNLNGNSKQNKGDSLDFEPTGNYQRKPSLPKNEPAQNYFNTFDLDSYYNNIRATQNQPKYENEDKKLEEISIADDLSQYIKHLHQSSMMENRGSNNPRRKTGEPDNNESYMSEGEVNFGDAIKFEENENQEENQPETGRLQEQSEAEDKSSGEMSFNYFDVEDAGPNTNVTNVYREREEMNKNDAGDYVVKEDDFGDDYDESF